MGQYVWLVLIEEKGRLALSLEETQADAITMARAYTETALGDTADASGVIRLDEKGRTAQVIWYRRAGHKVLVSGKSRPAPSSRAFDAISVNGFDVEAAILRQEQIPTAMLSAFVQELGLPAPFALKASVRREAMTPEDLQRAGLQQKAIAAGCGALLFVGLVLMILTCGRG